MDKKVKIDVNHVTIRFNKGTEKIDNLKEYAIKFVKRELMFQEFLAVQDVSFQVKEGEAWPEWLGQVDDAESHQWNY